MMDYKHIIVGFVFIHYLSLSVFATTGLVYKDIPDIPESEFRERLDYCIRLLKPTKVVKDIDPEITRSYLMAMDCMDLLCRLGMDCIR